VQGAGLVPAEPTQVVPVDHSRPRATTRRRTLTRTPPRRGGRPPCHRQAQWTPRRQRAAVPTGWDGPASVAADMPPWVWGVRMAR